MMNLHVIQTQFSFAKTNQIKAWSWTSLKNHPPTKKPKKPVLKNRFIFKFNN